LQSSFDFDDTLVPDTTTRLLAEYGIDTDAFWKNDVAALVADGFDPALAWLTLLLQLVGPDQPLRELNDTVLRDFGARTIDSLLYTSLPALFDDLRNIVSEFRDLSVEYYIVSGGLREFLLGSDVVRHYFAGVYGSQLGKSTELNYYTRIKRVVTFAEKTKYLFEINKGVRPDEALVNPLLVNRDVPRERRRVPFANMFYVGDGLTDIPCFSLLKEQGGTAFDVFDPARDESAKKAFIDFLKPKRVISIHAPRYGPSDELGSLLRAAIA